MPLPQDAQSLVTRVETAANRVISAVGQARFGTPTDGDRDASITVAAAMSNVDTAMQDWLDISDALAAELDRLDETDPSIAPQTQAARAVLSQLNIGVAGEVALLQPLVAAEQDENMPLADVARWLVPEQPSSLSLAASGPPGTRDAGLIALLKSGPADLGPIAPALGPHPVEHATEAITEDTADTVFSVLKALAVDPVLHALLPIPPDVTAAHASRIELVRNLLEEPVEWAIEKAADAIPTRVAKWAQAALRRATKLLVKVIGRHRFEQLNELLGGPVGATALVAAALKAMYDTNDVVQRGRNAFDPHSKPIQLWRATRLRQLERSNSRWLAPVEPLTNAIGPLWTIPVPFPPHIPAAPVAAAILIGWALLLGGDQLDSCHFPYLIFWHGVVDRASGH